MHSDYALSVSSYLPPIPISPLPILPVSFPDSRLWLLFKDSFSLTKVIHVAIGLKLSIGAGWGHQQIQN